MAVRLDVTHPELPTWRISSFQNKPSAAAQAAALVSKGARAARTLSSRESCRQPLGRTARAPSSRCDSTSTLAPWPRRPGAASEVNAAARPILGERKDDRVAPGHGRNKDSTPRPRRGARANCCCGETSSMPTICTRGGCSGNARGGWAACAGPGYETLTIRRSQGASNGGRVRLSV